jgi:hypothetical protein
LETSYEPTNTTTPVITTTPSITTTSVITTTPSDISLYEFNSHTFTNANKIGSLGPTLDDIKRAYSTVSWAQNLSFLFMTQQGIQEWKVPKTGNYIINAKGAGIPYNSQFGNILNTSGEIVTHPASLNQKGIDASITVQLFKNEVIKILVGQMPNNNGTQMAGAGGTFVIRGTQTPIIVAGGAGGRGNRYSDDTSDGNKGTSGKNPISGALGGIDGKGGGIPPYKGFPNSYSGAGGGLIGNGTNATDSNAKGGLSFIEGGTGGYGDISEGGFGGGGGASKFTITTSYSQPHSGGGGGGYSGGGAGGNGNYTKDNVTISELSNGGGGGSYSMIGTFDSIIANNNGNGSVTITYKS